MQLDLAFSKLMDNLSFKRVLVLLFLCKQPDELREPNASSFKVFNY